MSRCCSATNSSSPPKGNGDLMVETELEAAEVLASLSKSAAPADMENSSVAVGEPVGICEGKRLSVLVKNESSPVDSALNAAVAVVSDEESKKKGKKPVVLSFDLNEDQAATFEQDEECQKEPQGQIETESPALVEPGPLCTTSQNGEKSRQNLTEDEKEARRVRRVMANRESARKTIRRRQAIFEELARKATDLAWENENLKRQKDSVLKVFQALQRTNKNLNEQIAKQSESQIEENQGNSASAKNCSTPALPFTNYPYIICKEKPFVWPYNMQLPDNDPSQLIHSCVAHQSKASLLATSNPDSIDKGEVSSITGPSAQWCIVPCPLFFSVPDVKDSHNPIPFFPSPTKLSETHVDNQHTGTSSSKATACVINQCSEPTVCVKTEACSTADAGIVDQQLRCVDTSSLQFEGKSQFDGREAIGLKLTDTSDSEAAVSLGKRLVDSAAAAEARKRRKELTRLKTLHCQTSRKAGF